MPATKQVLADQMPSPRHAVQFQIVGVLSVAATALGWGLNWPATKLLIASVPPLSARGFAGGAACIFLLALSALCGETLKVKRVDCWRLFIGALLNVTVWMGGTTASLRWLPAGQAVTLAYTMPIWVSLLAWPILKERPTPRQAAAIVLGSGGIVVLVGPGNLSFGRDDVAGIALVLLAAMLFALGTVYGKARPVSLAPLALTAWQVGIGSIPLIILGFTFEAPGFTSLPLFGWAALGYTAVVSMGLCYVTWFIARARLSAPGAAIGTLLTPVIGVAASSLALGDAITANQLVALLLVATGIILATRPLPNARH
jgi:drug/metabolite transporter (DMT)-like permease